MGATWLEGVTDPMTVEKVELAGPSTNPIFRVYHRFKEDPTMGMYVSLVEVIEDDNQIRVGTPLICSKPLNPIEVQSLVQLLLGRHCEVETEPLDTIDLIQDSCPRCWKTYELNL
jgi:hypothetical protein